MHRFIPALLKIKGFPVGEVEANHRRRAAAHHVRLTTRRKGPHMRALLGTVIWVIGMVFYILAMTLLVTNQAERP